MSKDIEKVSEHVIFGQTGIEFDQGYTEDEHLEAGRMLSRFETRRQWYLGDWYNAIQWGDKVERCQELGLEPRSCEDYGNIAARYQIPDRSGILSWTHHKAVAYVKEPVRSRLLAEASAAVERGEKYSVAKLKKAAEEALLVTRKAPPRIKIDADKLPEEWEKVDNMVAPSKRKEYQERLHRLFDTELKVAVDKRIKERYKEERRYIDEKQKEIKEHEEQIIKLAAGVRAFMSAEEYKIVLSCLHPDRECSPERKQKAFVIFKRLEKTTTVM